MRVKIAEVGRPRVKAMYVCVCNIEMVGEPEDEATYMTVCTCTCVYATLTCTCTSVCICTVKSHNYAPFSAY